MRSGIIYFLFLTSFFNSTSLFAQMSPAEENHFKSGALTDFTPQEISSKTVKIGGEGPFLVVVGIKRDGYMVDRRPPERIEKIKFSLDKGHGKLAPMNDLTNIQKKEIILQPGLDGLVSVLFYPESSGDYSLTVSISGNPGISGTLNYDFHVETLLSEDFLKIAQKNLDTQKWFHRFVHNETNQLLRENYDRDGKIVVRQESKQVFISQGNDGSRELRENTESGKILVPKKTKELNEKNLPYNHGKPYGYTDQDIIYLDIHQKPEFMMMFSFYDKSTGNLNRSVLVDGSIVTVSNFEYQTINNHDVRKNETEQTRHFLGNKIDSLTVKYNY